jgi:endonuclease/exonuclease/phosphatase family metal-dependent hydrolase
MRSASFLGLTAAAVTSLALLVTPTVAAQAAPTQATTSVVTAQSEATPTQVRFATFNVRTARADIGTTRHWLRRALSVAREINKAHPGIVAIQELGPGRADGQKISIGTADRQTESLEKALSSVGAGQYKLARTTSYVKPGTSHGTQGARILFDTTKYSLVSDCVEKTGKSNYNLSCSMDLPIMSSDAKSATRSAAYAEFEDRATGEKFFVISVHLDNRHSSTLSKEKALDALRGAQAKAVYDEVSSLAGDTPVLFGGDINSWRTKAGSHAPFDYLTSQGFVDATTAPKLTDAKYPTVNHWKATLKANAKGRQVALDVVMVKGGVSFSTYENVMKVVNASRPSDHNMVVADLEI